jgi:CelD/BcsL family acetyltransferase involved in cellulose biosynthesis
MKLLASLTSPLPICRATPEEAAPVVASQGVCQPASRARTRQGSRAVEAAERLPRDTAFIVHRSLSEARPLWRGHQHQLIHTPFQDFDWIEAWQADVGAAAGVRPFVVCAMRGDEPWLVLPLAIERWMGGSRLTWLARDVNDYNAPLVSPEALCRLTLEEAQTILEDAFALARRHGASHAVLTGQPEFLGGSPNPFIGRSALPGSSSAHAAVMGASWHDFYVRRRGRPTRRRIAEKARRLEAIGPVSFGSVDEPDARARLVRLVLEWKCRQLAERGSRNPFSDPRRRDFFVRIAGDPSFRSFLTVYALEVGGEPVAGAFGMRGEGCFLLYQMAQCGGRYAHCSPGLILLTRMMEATCEAGLEVFDFTAGDEPYKLEWCNRRERLYDVIEALSPAGRLPAELLRQALKAKVRIKANAAAVKLIEAANRSLSALLRGKSSGAR